MMRPGRILGLILTANVLSILPFPAQISAMRPAWVLLCLLYFQTYIPRYFHVWMVLFLGLCLDASLSTPMGEHAFALLVTTWMMVRRAPRFMFFSMMQQMLMISLASGCYQLILFIVDASFGHMSDVSTIFGVAITSMFAWGPLSMLLRIQGVTDVR